MRKFIFLFIIIALVALARIVPHPWNFTPIGAVGFLWAYYSRPWWVGIGLSLLAMLVSDTALGFYHWPILVSVYAGLGLYAVCGRMAHKSASWRTNSSRTLSFTVIPSLVFFFLTNSAVWLFGTMYPHTWDGLIASLIAGIPFYRNMLIGDILYISVPIIIFTLYARRKQTAKNARTIIA